LGCAPRKLYQIGHIVQTLYQNKITIKPLFSPNIDYEGQILFPKPSISNLVCQVCPNLISYKQRFVKPLFQVYNRDMPRDHFAQLYKSPVRRHDSVSPSQEFNEAVGALCGMLYSVITLKAFFPSPPPPQMNYHPVKDVGAEGHRYKQLTLF